jgi:hypothetical protein
LEDLLGEAYYLGKVNEAYAAEFGDLPLVLNASTAGKRTLVDRVSDAFGLRNLGEYNKGRVAKRIMTDFAGKKLEAVDTVTAAGFRKLIAAINAVAAGWK